MDGVGGMVDRRTSEDGRCAAEASHPVKLVRALHVGVGAQANFKVTRSGSRAGVGEDGNVVDGNIVRPASTWTSFKRNLAGKKQT